MILQRNVAVESPLHRFRYAIRRLVVQYASYRIADNKSIKLNGLSQDNETLARVYYWEAFLLITLAFCHCAKIHSSCNSSSDPSRDFIILVFSHKTSLDVYPLFNSHLTFTTDIMFAISNTHSGAVLASKELNMPHHNILAIYERSDSILGCISNVIDPPEFI